MNLMAFIARTRSRVRLSRLIVVGLGLLPVATAAASAPPAALAASQAQLPFRCFAQTDVVHVVFGPQSFFLPKTQQGPTSFKENAGPTIVTYPLYHGSSQGKWVEYVVTDASDQSAANALGVNYVPKLANAVGTPAVQNSKSAIGSGNGIDFPGSVNYSPTHVIVPGPTGFPPAQAIPGAVADASGLYSPLVQVDFRGHPVVLNAPQIANATGSADKVISIKNNQVQYKETDGCYDNESVHYASFDASDPTAAAIEDVTYAPNLNFAPSAGCADPATPAPGCSREPLIAFTNGQTGATNIQRQGLNAALLDGPPPLNILKEIPEPTSRFDYSPMWDIHFETWTAAAVSSGVNARQTDFSTALSQVTAGLATGFGSPTVVPQGFVVNCPVVSLDVNPGG
jgi:hypothetical protein